MVRPCFLVIDPEHAGSISSRKLVIETAKFNVITAYSSFEAVATFSKYPAVEGIVVNSGMDDMPCDELIRRLKTLRADVPVIAIIAPRGLACSTADYYLQSFDPGKLLALLQTLVPTETARIEAREVELDD